MLADTPTHRYIVYTATYRPTSGPFAYEPRQKAGLFVQRGGRTISSQLCRASTAFDPLTRTLMPEVDYVEH